eukprot:scaffold98003_cov55-Attheya_sp.AAC.3
MMMCFLHTKVIVIGAPADTGGYVRGQECFFSTTTSLAIICVAGNVLFSPTYRIEKILRDKRHKGANLNSLKMARNTV